MKRIALLSISIFSALTFAECGSDYCQNVFIDQVELKKNGDLVFSTTGTESRLYCDPIRLTGSGDGILVPKNGNEAYSEMYSLLVSSQKSETPVTVRIISDEYDCIIDRIVSK